MKPDRVFVLKNALEFEDTRLFMERSGQSPVVVNDMPEVYRRLSDSEDNISLGKKILVLLKNRGRFIKECPGTKNYTCCGYMILHFGSFCSMDCSYCILQVYFHPPVLQYFVNRQDMIRELEEAFEKKRIMRIGTGEFTDSLIWEPLFRISSSLVSIFADQHSAVLELKTKTSKIKDFLELNHNRKTIFSWSVNTPEIIRSQERRTASLEARLQAASECERAGYPLGFHFDPLIIYKGCEEDYLRVVEKIFSAVSGHNIAWISLGTFRYIPELKSIIQKRFSDSDIIYHEFIPGLDGKMRYFKPIRIRLYKRIIDAIRSYSKDVLIYFCMESDDVWKKCFGYTPEEYGGLPAMLDRAAARTCDLH